MKLHMKTETVIYNNAMQNMNKFRFNIFIAGKEIKENTRT